MRAIGVVFSNIHDHNVPELVSNRTVGSIPFGGRYRLIDFALSNMINSGISKVLFPQKYLFGELLIVTIS